MPLNLAEFAQNGFAVVPAVLDAGETAALCDALALSGNVRNLLHDPAARRLCDCNSVRAMVEAALAPSAFPVRGVFFDKTPSHNWKVPWHQDLSIALRSRADAAGFGPWSVKAGVPHAQAPAHVLEQMLTVRIHLDDCGPDNGPLRVIPGSHMAGVLDAGAIANLRTAREAQLCPVLAGGVMLMKPLLLHASSLSTAPSHRRVIHLEFASAALPAPLEWYHAPS